MSEAVVVIASSFFRAQDDAAPVMVSICRATGLSEIAALTRISDQFALLESKP
jgi:hypothetical protein